MSRLNKNGLTIGLMIASLVLLVLLQVFWLTNSYKNAHNVLRRETSNIFRNTVFAMWDSIVATNIKPLQTDSVLVAHDVKELRAGNATAVATVENSIIRRGTRDSSAIKVVFSTRDSVPRDVLQPLLRRIETRSLGGDSQRNQTFIIRIGADSIDRTGLREKIKAALARAEIDADFEITRVKEEPIRDPFAPMHRGIMLRRERISMDRKSEKPSDAHVIVTDPVSITPVTEYTLSLMNVQPLLLRRISPEIAFSLILTTLTASAFLLMYRNIRSQQRLVRARNDLISNVTHELKTPVATVSVALEAIENFNARTDEALMKEYLSIARQELQRLSGMTDNILQMSILDEKGAFDGSELVDLNDIVAEAIEKMAIMIRQRGADVRFNRIGNHFTLKGSRLHLSGMVSNLIDNALKYTSITPEIDIVLTAREKEIELRVSDNGDGVPEEYREKIFEKFFRVPTGDVHETKGYGLGLSYVKTVAANHGGSIRVEGNATGGSTFVITFSTRRNAHGQH